MRKISFLAASLVVLAACGGSSDDTGGDVDSSIGGDTGSGGGDTGGGGDTSKTDSAKDAPSDSSGGDSETGGDTGTSGDTSTTDTGTTDSFVIDTSGDTSFACGDKTCVAGDVCIRTQVIGGACLVCGSGSSCPTGRHCAGGCCVPDPTYGCKPDPSACGSTPSCTGTCASALCGPSIGGGGCGCTGVDADGTVNCVICAP